MNRVLSISLAALLLAAVAFAALETWLDIHARQTQNELSGLSEPGQVSGLTQGAAAHPNH